MKPREAVSTALETQAVISKPRPNPRIRRFLITVHNRYFVIHTRWYLHSHTAWLLLL